MTPVAMPVLVVMLQFYPGVGTAVPAPRQGNSAVMSTFYTMDDCNRERASRGNPQDFFCLEYKSEKIIDYTFPQDKSKQGSLDNISVGPIALKDADRPFIEPLVEPKPEPKPVDTPKQAEQRPKRVAQQPRYQQEAMFEGNPIRGLFNW